MSKPDCQSFNHFRSRALVNQCCIFLLCVKITQVVDVLLCRPDPPSSDLICSFSYPQWTMALGHHVVQYLTHQYLVHSPRKRTIRLLGLLIHCVTANSRGASACQVKSRCFLFETLCAYLTRLIVVSAGSADVFFQYLSCRPGSLGTRFRLFAAIADRIIEKDQKDRSLILSTCPDDGARHQRRSTVCTHVGRASGFQN